MKYKSRKIEGMAQVVNWGSACIGLCGFETPFIEFDFIGEVFRLWADRVDQLIYENKLKEGSYVWIRAFVRKSTGQLFNVRILQVAGAIN